MDMNGLPDGDDAIDGNLDEAHAHDAVKLASSKAQTRLVGGFSKHLVLVKVKEKKRRQDKSRVKDLIVGQQTETGRLAVAVP